MAWYENGYFGFDTETTGVTESSDRIVSAAIVRYNSKHEVIHTLQWLINPGGSHRRQWHFNRTGSSARRARSRRHQRDSACHC